MTVWEAVVPLRAAVVVVAAHRTEEAVAPLLAAVVSLLAAVVSLRVAVVSLRVAVAAHRTVAVVAAHQMEMM